MRNIKSTESRKKLITSIVIIAVAAVLLCLGSAGFSACGRGMISFREGVYRAENITAEDMPEISVFELEIVAEYTNDGKTLGNAYPSVTLTADGKQYKPSKAEAVGSKASTGCNPKTTWHIYFSFDGDEREYELSAQVDGNKEQIKGLHAKLRERTAGEYTALYEFYLTKIQ